MHGDAPPHPGFEWSIVLPAHWIHLDTRPGRWQRCAFRLMAQYGGDITVFDRVAMVAEASRSAGAFLTLLSAGTDSANRWYATALTVAWVRVPIMTSLARVAGSLDDSGGEPELITAASGQLLVHASGDGAAVQVFRHLTGTPWLAVITAHVPEPMLHNQFRDLLIGMSESISGAPAEAARSASPVGRGFQSHRRFA